MAEDTSDPLVFFLEIAKTHDAFLGHIRHWDNLKAATDMGVIWIKGFTEHQLNSTILQSIPFIKLYTCKNNLLFPKGSLLPVKKVPNLLWTPIETLLPVTLAGYNHHFFGLPHSIPIKLSTSYEEQQATVILVDVASANHFISNASFIRTQPLKWVLINQQHALIFGEPLLPLNGTAFWQKGNFIFPLGYQLEFPILEKIIEDKIGSNNNVWIWWNTEQSYCVVDKSMLQPLTIASWKQTLTPH